MPRSRRRSSPPGPARSWLPSGPYPTTGAAVFAGRFYAELGRSGTAEALAVAQRALLADARFRHPYYWAGYRLAGSGINHVGALPFHKSIGQSIRICWRSSCGRVVLSSAEPRAAALIALATFTASCREGGRSRRATDVVPPRRPPDGPHGHECRAGQLRRGRDPRHHGQRLGVRSGLGGDAGAAGGARGRDHDERHDFRHDQEADRQHHHRGRRRYGTVRRGGDHLWRPQGCRDRARSRSPTCIDELGIIGGTWSRAHAINDRGEVVGSELHLGMPRRPPSTGPESRWPWRIWGPCRATPAVGRTRSTTAARFGEVYCKSIDPGCPPTASGEMVLWEKTGDRWTATRLGVPVPLQRGHADINNSGQFVRSWQRVCTDWWIGGR